MLALAFTQYVVKMSEQCTWNSLLFIYNWKHLFIQNHNSSSKIFFLGLVKRTLLLVNKMVDHQRVKAASVLHAQKNKGSGNAANKTSQNIMKNVCLLKKKVLQIYIM